MPIPSAPSIKKGNTNNPTQQTIQIQTEGARERMSAPMAGNENRDFATDVLVDILLRLPPSHRRRARLVSRHWRGTVDNRMTETQRCAVKVKTLISVVSTRSGMTISSRYVVDDLSGWRFMKVLTSCEDVHVIGTCNGLICLCNDGKPGGAVSLANPVTGQKLVVPPLPRYRSSGQGQPAPSVRRRWHEAYSFGYHPLTGRYKIVHVPCYLDPIAGCLDVVHVFTLGESSWRDVPLPAAVRAIGTLGSGGVVSVDGTTYWLAENVGAGKVLSLDLADERLYASPLPVAAKPGATLKVVRGRLGVALDRNGKTDVWVLDGRRWSRRYEVELDGWQRLTSPHFAQGKYVLTVREPRKRSGEDSLMYGHTLSEKRSLLLCNVSRSSTPAVRSIEGSIDRTFAYVSTTEPLSVYQTASVAAGVSRLQ